MRIHQNNKPSNQGAKSTKRENFKGNKKHSEN